MKKMKVARIVKQAWWTLPETQFMLGMNKEAVLALVRRKRWIAVGEGEAMKISVEDIRRYLATTAKIEREVAR